MPIVAGPEKFRIPDDPSKASGDRLQIPGASTSGDLSREVLQYDVPSQENPGQASGDRLIAFPRHRRHRETGRTRFHRGFKFSQEGLSSEPPDTQTQCRGGTT